ncbi:acyl carrier protein [Candidatus Woesearchaeota archaeon]|nr:MAG: acyl carrier protein [Candidatus Woesearchaeota archaeon]
MNPKEIEKKFKEIVADIFHVPISKIKGTTRFVEDLNAKSMDIVALIAATENTFGIKVPTQEARKNKTVAQAIAYIKKKLKKQ